MNTMEERRAFPAPWRVKRDPVSLRCELRDATGRAIPLETRAMAELICEAVNAFCRSDENRPMARRKDGGKHALGADVGRAVQ